MRELDKGLSERVDLVENAVMRMINEGSQPSGS